MNQHLCLLLERPIIGPPFPLFGNIELPLATIK